MLALVPSVAGELSRYSAISLRKGGSSAAAAAGIADHVRQRVGRGDAAELHARLSGGAGGRNGRALRCALARACGVDRALQGGGDR